VKKPRPCPVCGGPWLGLADHGDGCTPALRALVRAAVAWAGEEPPIGMTPEEAALYRASARWLKSKEAKHGK
jgi:hypothetical protein